MEGEQRKGERVRWWSADILKHLHIIISDMYVDTG